jgi:ATP-binding cassette subfamily B protein
VITIDDQPLARMPAEEWRNRLASAFEDFFRFELRARHAVGLGDVPRLDDEPAVAAAVDRAVADVVARLTAGLETQLGPTWPGGVKVGTHDELLSRGGQYAELYGIRAAAYR